MSDKNQEEQFNPAADPVPDESEFRQSSIEKDRMVFLNMKRTYDAYQDLDLLRARQDARNSENIANIAQQALQNAVTTANAISAQAVRIVDLASDRQWNINETDQLAAIIAKALDNSVPLRVVDSAAAKSTDTSVQIQAIAAAVAVAVATALNRPTT
jgi:predicted oxidoreductase (fatty acid repression mutant protein)